MINRQEGIDTSPFRHRRCGIFSGLSSTLTFEVDGAGQLI